MTVWLGRSSRYKESLLLCVRFFHRTPPGIILIRKLGGHDRKVETAPISRADVKEMIIQKLSPTQDQPEV